MRKSEQEITDRGEVEAILRRARVVHVGMVDDGRPYVVPMNFGYADGCLILHSAPEGRKIDVLRRNPDVCFEVTVDAAVVPGDAPCRYGAKYRSVIGYGTATFIEDPGEKARALDALMGKFASGPFEYSPKAVSRAAIIRVEIQSMTGKQAGYG